MKRIAIILLALVPLLLSAQSYILRGGPKVYRYEKAQKRWSPNPLPLGTRLESNDYIISETNFTLEVLPDDGFVKKFIAKWNPLHKNSCVTYIAYPRETYPKGVRLSSNLTEFKNTAKAIRSGVTYQGAMSLPINNSAFLSHLSWAYNECIKDPVSCIEDSTSSVDVILVSSSLRLDSISVSASDSLKMTLINKNDYNVYVYVLWKDNKWMLWDWDKKNVVAYRLSPFSCYSQTINFDNFIGEQDLFFVFSQKELDDKVLKSFNYDIVPCCEENYKQSRGYSYTVKRIITTK